MKSYMKKEKTTTDRCHSSCHKKIHNLVQKKMYFDYTTAENKQPICV